ncbi:MAG: pilus assembly protein FimV, partial [Undibacterium sp.]|nr:pilus assembly protein FimV [Undibacterium sp.]
APSASQLDANEVDPVAEADVYIAYGRDTQAEEILKEALRTQPDRHAVRLKLLEIYFGRKDPRAFELFAGELYGMTRGEGEEWAQAASMGASLDPMNPLYAGASAQPDAFIAGAVLNQPTQPLEDLDPEALLENSLSEDMLESISIIDIASASDDGQKSSDKFAPTNVLEDPIGVDDLDFDLGISEEVPALDEFVPTLPEMDAVSSIVKVQEEEAIPSIDFGSIDFDFDDDSEEASVTGSSLSSGLNLDKAIEPAVKSDLHLDELTMEDENSGLGALDFVLPEMDGFAAKAAQTAANLKDMQGVSDSLPVHEHTLGAFDFEPQHLEGHDQVSDQGHEHGLDGLEEIVATDLDEVSPYNAEMATKLDLAVAYQEIGDKEGARELLEEVLKGGSKDQLEKAKAMLAQLG